MTDDAKSTSILPYGQFVLAALVLLGVVTSLDPLRSSRPDGGISPYNAVPDAQDVPARLWQDPFDAVADEVGAPKSPARDARHKADLGENRHGMKAFGKTVSEMKRIGAVASIAVMVPADGFPERQESRRRARYAVVAALNASGYAARDPGEIGYVWTDRPVDERKGNGGRGGRKGRAGHLAHRGPHGHKPASLPELVPYEVFLRQSKGQGSTRTASDRSLLVLWLDEHGFSDDPQASLMELARQIGSSQVPSPMASPHKPMPSVTTIGGKDRSNDRFLYVLGPVTSETLAAIPPGHEDGASGSCAPDAYGPVPPHLVFLSYSATSASARRADTQGSGCASTSDVIRAVGDDTALVKALVEELVLRRQMPVVKDAQAAHRFKKSFLIAFEQDARYSREAAQALQEEIEKRATETGAMVAVRRVGYLRGLDGKEVGGNRHDAADDGDQPRRKSSGGEAQVPRDFEAAEGRDQFDYLRRSAAAIAARVAGEKSSAARTVDAVFVFGADTYDRLLLLRAFKEHFPHAFYATNDLDARLLQKDQLPWTRNLVVASHFGLGLRPELQLDTAPFRSDHQASLYLSTLAALAAIGEQRADGAVPRLRAKFLQWLDHGPAFPVRGVRLSEVGRGGLVQLDANGSATDMKTQPGSSGCSLASLLDPDVCANVQPPNNLPGLDLRPSPDVLRGCIWLAGLIGVGLAIMFARAHRGCRRLVWCVAFGLPSLMSILIRRALGRRCRRIGWGAPRLAVVQAIRAWPMVLMVIAAAVVVGYCVRQLQINALLLADGRGEPVSFVSGTSFWPQLLVRLVAITFWVWAMAYTWRRFHGMFRGKLDKITLHQWRFIGTRQYGMLALWTGHPMASRIARRIYAARARVRRALPSFLSRATTEPLAPFLPVPKTPGRHVDVVRLLRRYRQRASLAHAWPWLLLVTFLFWCSPLPLAGILGIPTDSNWRDGGIFGLLDKATLMLFIIAAASTSAAAFYQTRRCGAFITALNSAPSAWPDRSLEWAANELGLPQRKRHSLNDYMDFDCVVNCTERMNWFVYPPFVLFALALVNRTALFDAEYFPLPLLAPSILALALTLYVAHRVYEMAEEAKRRAVFKYRQRARSPLRRVSRAAMLDADEAEFVACEIEKQRRGAFAPWWKKPWFHSLLLTAAVPLGGSTVDLVKLLVTFA